MPTNTPRIAGSFNGFHYKQMREIVPFVEENDNNKPDFAKMCLDELILKPWQYEDMDAKANKIVETRKQKYYEENWSTLIMKHLHYPNPLVANAHKLTSITSKIDPGSKVYFHVDFVKPGRHTYLISHDKNSIVLAEDDAI